MTYLEWIDSLNVDTRPQGWRKGQYVFNMLYEVRPDLAIKARGGAFDPFHQDVRLPSFYEFARLNW